MTAEELKQIFGRAVPDRGKLQEIRLRAGKPVLVFMDGREYMVGREGLLEPDADLSPVLADPALIREILGIFSRYSLYAFEDEIRQGFLTIEGGHRVGIAGKAVTEGSGLRTIRDISSLNIRLAHEKPGCGDPVLPWLYENDPVAAGIREDHTFKRRGAPGIQWKPVRAGSPDSGGG